MGRDVLYFITDKVIESSEDIPEEVNWEHLPREFMSISRRGNILPWEVFWTRKELFEQIQKCAVLLTKGEEDSEEENSEEKLSEHEPSSQKPSESELSDLTDALRVYTYLAHEMLYRKDATLVLRYQ